MLRILDQLTFDWLEPASEEHEQLLAEELERDAAQELTDAAA